MEDKLYVLWSSGDPEVARNMIFMYINNALRKQWWNRVTLIIWGPSALLIKEVETIRQEMQLLMESGVEVIACKSCTEKYGATEIMESLGVNVYFTGELLTDILRLKKNLLSV